MSEKLKRDIEKALRATGLPWRIEAGSKHRKVVLDGACVGVLSNGNRRAHDGRNILMKIEKKAKEC